MPVTSVGSTVLAMPKPMPNSTRSANSAPMPDTAEKPSVASADTANPANSTMLREMRPSIHAVAKRAAIAASANRLVTRLMTNGPGAKRSSTYEGSGDMSICRQRNMRNAPIVSTMNERVHNGSLRSVSGSALIGFLLRLSQGRCRRLHDALQ